MRPPRRFLHPLCLAALITALALLAWDSSLRLREVSRMTAVPGVLTDAPAEDSKSPAGYALGRRNLILPEEGADGYHWVMQTQQMFAERQLRVRQVNYDNAPDGREVHWASPLRWWLGAVAWVHHFFSGNSLPISVERSASYANPLLFAVALLLLTPVVAQRFGAIAGAFFALSSVCIGPYSWFFSAPIPDHHGIATLCGLMCALFLMAGGGGWVRQQPARPSDIDPLSRWLPETNQARHWFIASGIAGGAGLWISAASQTLVLIGIGCAAALVGWMAKPSKAEPQTIAYKPILWRIWGLAGAATSLAAYLIEYFPGGSGWRLEVNHPLYALAWAGAGELLHAGSRWRTSGQWINSGRDKIFLAFAVVAMFILPLAVILTHESTFGVADPFLFQLHKNYIEEFQPLSAYFKNRETAYSILLCLPLLTFGLAGFFWCKPGSNKAVARSLLVLTLLPAAVMLIFSLGQSRWFGVACGLLVAGFVFLSWLGTESAFSKARRFWVSLFLLGCLLFVPIRTFVTWKNGPRSAQEDVYPLALRDLAGWLRLRAGTEPCVIASSPTLTTTLVFHGGLRGIGTLYWENRPGLRTAADLFAAKTEGEAHRIVREHGITHIITASWDDFLAESVRLVRKIPGNAMLPDDVFILQLIKTKSLPSWLRLAPYRLPAGNAFANQQLLVFEVVPPQPPEAPPVNLVNFLLDTGEPMGARQLAPDLAKSRSYFPALIASGRLALQQKDSASLQTIMAELKRRLTETDNLSLEDNIRLGSLLAFAGDISLAKEQLARCAARMNEHDVRHLSARTAFNFLDLVQRLSMPNLAQSMKSLVLEILPPKSREQLSVSAHSSAP